MEDPSERIVDRMRDESAASGARLVLLPEGVDAAMRAHATARGIPVVEVESVLQGRGSGVPLRYTGQGTHWTPEGHRVVAELVAPVLADAVRAP
jgi:lysophospholipase L1-like esterase